MKGLAKAVLPVVIGVMVAGLIMKHGYGLPLVGDASDGFDM